MPTAEVYAPSTRDSLKAKRERVAKFVQSREGRKTPNRAAARIVEVSENMIRNLRRELGLKSPVPRVGERLVKQYVAPGKKNPAPKAKKTTPPKKGRAKVAGRK